MWPFKRRTEVPKDLISLRLAGHSSDILIIYERLYRIESALVKLDKRVEDLEKILKTCNIHVTSI